MSEHYQNFYRERAADFHRLVMAEDCEGNLASALRTVLGSAGRAPSGADSAGEDDLAIDAIEIGVGTGRLTGLLVQSGVRSLLGIEREDSMLAIAREYLRDLVAQRSRPCAIDLRVGDLADGIPSESASADLVIAGWVFGHMTHWFADDWPTRLRAILDEAERVTRAGGYHVIIETLGTGALTPAPPNAGLAGLYRCLEEEHGFRRQELSTDYQFPSVAEAVEVCGAFFGESMAASIRTHSWARVPEWTALFWRRVAS